MSLKENLDYVKEELSAQEKFIENFVKTERFFKKHKIKVIVAVALAIVVFVVASVTSYIKEQNEIKANRAYLTLLKDPNDTKAIDILKNLNPKLLEIAKYQNALKNSNIEELSKIKNIPFVTELAQYEVAIIKKDIDKLNYISLNNNALLKDLATFNQALLLLEQNKIKEVKVLLNTIKEDSAVNSLVTILKHYMITKK